MMFYNDSEFSLERIYNFMKKRSTNYELLRIILTLFIPIYHWLLYNGIVYAENSTNNLLSMVPFSGIPFSCLYAFIAMSSYFLLKKQYKWNAQKFLVFLAQIITLLVFKNIFIRTLFRDNMYDFIGDFFINGAWWYVWAYLVMMLLYPVFNYFIYNSSKTGLYVTTFIIGALFAYNVFVNKTSFINDCIAFVFVYFIMGCLERHNGTSKIFANYKNIILICIIAVFALALTFISIYLKFPYNTIPLELENALLQKFHGRYNPFGLIAGIAIFKLFKNIEIPYTPFIHKISKITFYVFLLHETVMSVFWFYEIKGTENLAYLPTFKYFLLIVIYMACCIITAFIIYKIYTAIIEPIWIKLIDKLCNTSFIKEAENFYNDIFTSEHQNITERQGYNPSIGILKFILSLLVVAIHVQPLSGNKAFYLNNCIARLAVPIFFVLSAYFLFDKLIKNNWDKKIFYKQQKHLAKYYGIWLLLHIPIILLQLYKTADGPLNFIWLLMQGIFLKGPYGALWFLPASLLGLALVYYLGKRTSPKICLLCSLPLFLFATMQIEYNAFVKDIAWINSTNHILTSIFGWLANGFNVGFFFCSLGFYIASNKAKLRNKKADIFKLGLSIVLLLIETSIIRIYNLGVDYWAMFFIIPTTYYTVQIVLNMNSIASPNMIKVAKYLQNMSLLIYPMHFAIMDLMKHVFASNTIYMGSTTLQFIAVLLLTCGISIVILYFGEKRNSKIFKALYGK